MKILSCAVALALAASAAVVAGQDQKAEPPETPAAPAAKRAPEPTAAVPLKVTVVISRHRGDKRLSSLPYELGVAANGSKTTLRMGSDIPMPGPRAGQYRSVGTNIDCSAYPATAGQFQLALTVQDSSVHLDGADKPVVPPDASSAPVFRTFNSSFTALLRDGQVAEYTSATDPVTGEVMKIELRLHVMK